jgi:hypothetical protein
MAGGYGWPRLVNGAGRALGACASKVSRAGASQGPHLRSAALRPALGLPVAHTHRCDEAACGPAVKALPQLHQRPPGPPAGVLPGVPCPSDRRLRSQTIQYHGALAEQSLMMLPMCPNDEMSVSSMRNAYDVCGIRKNISITSTLRNIPGMIQSG